VSSLEVEDTLLQHPSVAFAAVVGLPDAYWGEAVAAFVVARPGHDADPADILSFCKARLTSYKVPKRVEVIDKMPTDPQGKIRKRELRAAYSTPIH
jgi:acyl-CoA synthetase (AMP-forming)/AMP-acid ligase II